MKKEAKEKVKETKAKKDVIKKNPSQKEIEKKESKKATNKKEIKKKEQSKKKSVKKENKNIFKRLWNFFGDVKKEMKKVHFPNRKEMVKYSIATLSFIVFFSLFFYLIDVIFALIRSMV